MKSRILMILLCFFVIPHCSIIELPESPAKKKKEQKRLEKQKVMRWILDELNSRSRENPCSLRYTHETAQPGQLKGPYVNESDTCFHVSASAPFTVKVITNSTNKATLTFYKPVPYDYPDVEETTADDPSMSVTSRYNDVWIRVRCYDACKPYSVQF